MSPTNYERGRALEYRVRDKLIADGYTVFRMAGSKSPVDLIAYKGRDALFVQVDGSQRGPGRAKKLALVDIAEDCGTRPVMYTPKGGFEFLRDAA